MIKIKPITADEKLEQERNQIMISINQCRNEIQALENEIKEYEAFKSQINGIISNLRNAQNSALESKEQLLEVYSSESANMQISKITNEANRISSIASTLSSDVLSEIEQEITEIELKIKNKKRLLASLINQL